MGEFSKEIDETMKNLVVPISRLKEHFNKVILDLRLVTEDLRLKSNSAKMLCS